MTDQPQPAASGQDLARQALNAYKAGAKNTPGPARKAKTKTRRVDRSGGRDPVGVGPLLGTVTAEQGWHISLGGGGILGQWADLCPQYVGRVEAVAFDPERGRLDLRPGNHAYAAQLRLLAGQLAKQINDKLPQPVVRSVRILPVGTVAAATTGVHPTSTGQNPAAPEQPAGTYYDVFDGYHQARAVALKSKGTLLPENPLHQPAIEGSNRALVDPRRREPVELFNDAVAAQEPTADEQRTALEASIRAARIRARQEKSGAVLAEPVRLFGAA
ncbi:DciA family protein [Streptomyces sp. NPDC088348]|uniref:DciA family protein n=1 Tax=Streptomyces sp. NPDC088348 TaxID=3365853 RepID=UPI0038235232